MWARCKESSKKSINWVNDVYESVENIVYIIK